jgi:hypothetical protein
MGSTFMLLFLFVGCTTRTSTGFSARAYISYSKVDVLVMRTYGTLLNVCLEFPTEPSLPKNTRLKRSKESSSIGVDFEVDFDGRLDTSASSARRLLLRWIVSTPSSTHIIYDSAYYFPSTVHNHYYLMFDITDVQIAEHEWTIAGKNSATHIVWITNNSELQVDSLVFEMNYQTSSGVNIFEGLASSSGRILPRQTKQAKFLQRGIDNLRIVKTASISLASVFYSPAPAK